MSGWRSSFGAPAYGVALALWTGWAAAGERMLYVVEGDAVVFTNLPTPGARPLPGFEPAPRAAAPRAPGVRRPLPQTFYDPHIERVARENGVSAELIKAVAAVESGFDAEAVSPAGAQGLMQLMPRTAEAYGVTDAFDPVANLEAGARHLRVLLDEFEGDTTLALAAYNAGSAAVRRYNGVPRFPETRDYVKKVHERLGSLPSLTPAQATAPATQPVRVEILHDGSVLLSN